MGSEPENQSNLEMNALWNHFVFPVIGTAKRAFIFKLSALAHRANPGRTARCRHGVGSFIASANGHASANPQSLKINRTWK
jgi:hypothetical protein